MPRAWFVSALTASCLGLACGEHGRPTREASPTSRVPDGLPAHRSAISAPRHARKLGLTRQLPAAYLRVCERQARDAPPPARTCPPLVPTGSLRVLYSGPSLGRDSGGGGYSADLASRSLGRLGGRRVETNGGHWRYDVAWSPAVRSAVVRFVERPSNSSEPSSCRRVRVADQEMEACRVVPYQRGGGLNGGHIAYVWSHAGVTYVISVHGYANEPRARAMMTAQAVVRGISVTTVERALLAHGGPPSPTTASCRVASPAERASAPFGRTRRPLFTCELTVTGEHASYVVQVLDNGCFVAERHRPGRAVYGCGANRS